MRVLNNGVGNRLLKNYLDKNERIVTKVDEKIGYVVFSKSRSKFFWVLFVY